MQLTLGLSRELAPSPLPGATGANNPFFILQEELFHRKINFIRQIGLVKLSYLPFTSLFNCSWRWSKPIVENTFLVRATVKLPLT